ncbi:MAG: ABC transporter substrate-binding protein [Blautia sp.]|nr:ABC transporter substrate-binding protein [Blautia sp.]
MQKKKELHLKKNLAVLLTAAVMAGGISQCNVQPVQGAEQCDYLEEAQDAPDVAGLQCIGQMKLDYAECFDVFYYENDYTLLDVYDSGEFLLIPEGSQVPEGLSEDIVVLKQPLNKIYLQATSAMALFRALDCMDHIRLVGTDANGWYIDETVEAINNGDMLFAGKYSEPDYEMLVNEECDLALESTMLLHTPKVQEMIKMLDIPVLIERASYEKGTLGRTEWIKFYGAMMDKEQEAYDFFEKQKKIVDDLEGFQNTGKTIAFFYVNSEGTVVVRKTDDYIVNMINIAGAKYAFDDLSDEADTSTSSSITLSMEQFYAQAKDADFLVYNATIADPIKSVDELLSQSELFADFKAVKEGNVWTTDKAFFQATDIAANLILDFNHLVTGQDLDQMTFLTKVD